MKTKLIYIFNFLGQWPKVSVGPLKQLAETFKKYKSA